MDLPALMPRGFWIRVIVISATLAVFVFAALVMAREHSPAGIVLFAILALFSLARFGSDHLAQVAAAVALIHSRASNWTLTRRTIRRLPVKGSCSTLITASWLLSRYCHHPQRRFGGRSRLNARPMIAARSS
jgi:hypothetical protein